MTPLVVTAPEPCTARIRFVASQDAFSRLIRLDNVAPVSHTEAVLPDGIYAALTAGGVKRLPYDYAPKDTLQIFVDIPMAPGMYATWRSFLQSRVGWKYDTAAIAGFIFHNAGLHDPRKLICSAYMTDALRHCGFWAKPLAAKYHSIDPVTVLLMLQSDARTIVRATEYAA